MRRYLLLGVPLAAAALVVGSAVVAGDVKSGPQVGGRILVPFHPLNVTGPDEGKKQCLV
jgi:hypothetical protein